MRCRLVTRDFKPRIEDPRDLFAAMPPLEAKESVVRVHGRSEREVASAMPIRSGTHVR